MADQQVIQFLESILDYWSIEKIAHDSKLQDSLNRDSQKLIDDPDFLYLLKHQRNLKLVTGYGGHRQIVGSFSWIPGQRISRSFRPDESQEEFVSAPVTAVLARVGEELHDASAAKFVAAEIIQMSDDYVTLKWPVIENYEPRHLISDTWIHRDDKEARIEELIDLVKSGQLNHGPTLDILDQSRSPKVLDDNGQFVSDFTYEKRADIEKWVTKMDGTLLAIQGPPGSGKTTTAAMAALKVVSGGGRVAISGLSHEAPRRVIRRMEEIERALERKPSDTFHFAEQTRKGERNNYRFKTRNGLRTKQKDILAGATPVSGKFAQVVCATSFLLVDSIFGRNSFDLLIIEEASQYGIGELLAISRIAKNILVIGDPAQLQHFTKSEQHLNGADASVMTHVLGVSSMLPTSRGIFLRESYRMSQDICRYISRNFYADQLEMSRGCEKIEMKGLPSLVRLRVEHEDSYKESVHEAGAAIEISRKLLSGPGREWEDKSGRTTKIKASDILILAPFNDHVELIGECINQSPDKELFKGLQILTVNKAQGIEKPIVIYSVACSDSRLNDGGLAAFIHQHDRTNVAISRAQAMAVLICTDEILHIDDEPQESSPLKNFCEVATTIDFGQIERFF